MKIALGTTSVDKKNMLNEALLTRGLHFEIEPFQVPSGIPEQPITEASTAIGAKNRAKAAYKASNKADIGIGMEAGLELIDGCYFFVAVVAIYDPEGDKFYTAYSGKMQLPTAVDEAVKNGEEFGLEIRDFNEANKESVILSATVHKLLGRKESFIQAINYAFDTFLTKEFYRPSAS